MGAGLHGLNGLNPEVSRKIWLTYISPRMLYGLEIVSLRRDDINNLELYFRNFRKQIQNLPTHTANEAAFLLLGLLPLEAELDRKVLTMFVNIAWSDGVEKNLAERQLLVKPHSSKSWFVTTDTLLRKYDLPSALQLLKQCLSKLKW